ncbi:MAG TPA: hypothetical protein VFU55_11985 [Terracidiphilus sp.]|nr:hypothetical protein [Terracidiphilus sp.]
MKRLVQVAASVVLLAPTGCIFHRHREPAPPQALAPSPLETTQVDNSSTAAATTAPVTTPAQTPPATATPPATQPATQPPAATAQQNPPHHIFHRKKPQPKPVEEASGAAPEVSAVGRLSPGDPSDLRLQTDSSLSYIEKTLKKLNPPFNNQEQKTIAQIREFLKQARAALATGDVDGAHTLALKAQVLLNEITH